MTKVFVEQPLSSPRSANNVPYQCNFFRRSFSVGPFPKIGNIHFNFFFINKYFKVVKDYMLSDNLACPHPKK